jgi:ABC-type polysaccharide/polyol phosphate export permease
LFSGAEPIALFSGAGFCLRFGRGFFGFGVAFIFFGSPILFALENTGENRRPTC